MKQANINDGLQRLVESYKPSENIGQDVSEFQKWVDYDMKKYHKISKDTMNKVKKAGLSVVKDQYGDYEVIASRPVKESLEDEDYMDFLHDLSEHVKECARKWKSRGISMADLIRALDELAVKYEDLSDEDLTEALSDDLKKVNLNKFNVGTLPYQVLQFLWDLSENGKLDDRSLERQANNILELINRNISNESFNEALSDEAKANNEMIQRILNKKPSQLTAQEKKFLADNNLVRTGGKGQTPSIGKYGAPCWNTIGKGDRSVPNRGNLASKSKSLFADINDVDQLNLLKKRQDRWGAHNDKTTRDILEPILGSSELQDFNRRYQHDIKTSKYHADSARRNLDSYLKTGSRFNADEAQYHANVSHNFKDWATKNLENRPKFSESLEDDDYYEKSLHEAFSNEAFLDVYPVYTGGGIYVFYGDCKDDVGFVTSNSFGDYFVELVDVNMKNFIENNPFDTWDSLDDSENPDYEGFYEKHRIKTLTDKQGKKFILDMLDWILENNPRGSNVNYASGDIEDLKDSIIESDEW